MSDKGSQIGPLETGSARDAARESLWGKSPLKLRKLFSLFSFSSFFLTDNGKTD